MTHLGRVQPVLQVLPAADVRQDESVKPMFTCEGQQSSAHSDAQQHEESRKVTDAHLQSLTQTAVPQSACRGRRQVGNP